MIWLLEVYRFTVSGLGNFRVRAFAPIKGFRVLRVCKP